MIQMVSGFSFWFSWFSVIFVVAWCVCTKEQTPARLPGAAQPLPRRMLPPPRAAVENLSDVGGWRSKGSFGLPEKKTICILFCNYGPESEFHIDRVCLVAEVVAFGSLFLRHVVFFQHIVLLPRPLWQQQAPSEKCRHTSSGNWGVFHLGNRSPAFGRTATWFGQQWGFRGKDTKTGTDPGTGSCWLNDFLRFQYFPEIVVQYFVLVPGVVLPVTVKEAYAYLSKFTLFLQQLWLDATVRSHAQKPFCFGLMFFWGLCCRHCPHPRPTKKRQWQCGSSPYFFFNDLWFDLTNNRWLPEFQAQHGVLCGFLRASRRPIRRKTSEEK